MKPEVKKLWVAELRNEKYEKLKFNAHILNTNKYCVFALLQKIYCEETKKPIVSDLILPIEVDQWSGCTFNTKVEYKNRKVSLIHLNDKTELTLKEIADIIEQQL